MARKLALAPPLLNLADRVAKLEDEVREWQRRYHELALRIAENVRSSAVVPPDPAPDLGPALFSTVPALPIVVQQAVDSRTDPFSHERTLALDYARDALASGTTAEAVAKAILDGERVDV